jgi:hypothetical protein
MKVLLGTFLIVLGICGGIYVGGYLMFFRGIIQFIQSVVPNVIPLGIAVGIVKIMFASLVGWIIFAIGSGIGGKILGR